MFEQNNANPPADGGADNTANQMDEEIDLDALEQEKDVEKLRTQLRTTVEQKKHWRDKAAKFESDPRLKAPVEAPAPKPKPKTGEPDYEEIENRVADQLATRQKYPDMTEDEVARAKQLAKAEGKKFSEVVNDEYFQAYMRVNRDKIVKENARPSPSNRSGNPTSFTISDLNDPEKLARMDNETFLKLSNEAARAGKGKWESSGS